jgi:membrane protein
MLAQTALVLGSAARSFQKNRGLIRASSLALYCFLALPPLLLLITVLLSSFFTSAPGVEDHFIRFLNRNLPFVAQTILVEVRALARSRAWSLVAMLVLFWSITPLAAAVRQSMTDIFRAAPRRSYFVNKGGDALAVLLILIILLTLTVVETLRSVLLGLFAGHVSLLALLAQLLLPLAVSTLLLALVFRITVPIRIRARELFIGAFITAALLMAIGPALTAILRLNPDYGFTFGSLKAVFLLIVWVYYSFAALLFGAEVMANIGRREANLLARLFRHGRAGRLAPSLLQRLTRTLPPGTELFRQNDAGSEMFYVLAGSVEMVLEERAAKVFGEGDYFGEMALLLGSPRTATMRAGARGAEVAAISTANLDVILLENPDLLLSLLREMAQRLKTTNERNAAAATQKGQG